MVNGHTTSVWICMLSTMFIVDGISGTFVVGENMFNCPSIPQFGCSIELDQTEKTALVDDWNYTKSLLAKLKLNFVYTQRSNLNLSNIPGVILPTHWIVTTNEVSHGNLFTSWPVEYGLFSFGLLDSRTLEQHSLTLMFEGTCNIIGFEINGQVCELVKALLNINIQPHERNGFKSSITNSQKYRTHWCYLKEYPGIRDTGWYTLKVYFAFPLRMFGYMCCHAHKGDPSKIICNNKFTRRWNQYQVLPYYIGIVFFCFFPILLMKCSSRAMQSSRPIEAVRREYHDIDETDRWIYLRTRSPITISDIFLSLFGLGTYRPVAATRLRRLLFVIGLPILVYAEIALYYIGWPELVPALVHNNISFGFPTILGGIKDSRHLFLPMFGGPFISLIIYFVIGIIFWVTPRDHGSDLEKGLPSDNEPYLTLLKMNLTTIERVSSVRCIRHSGYKKIYSALKGGVFMLSNPKFWSFVWQYNINRWKSLVGTHKSKCILACLCPLYAVLCLLYIVFSFVEITLSILYYGLPIGHFLCVCIRGYAATLQGHFKNTHCIVGSISLLVTSLPLLYLLFMSCLIILTSMTFLTSIIFFLYLSVVIFPTFSFTLVYAVLMLLFFAYRIGCEMEQDYFHLLHETIKAIKYLNKRQMEFILTAEPNEDGMLILKNERIYQQQRYERIRIRREVPGIERELFDSIVEKHRPLHIAIFLSIIQVALMCTLVFTSIAFVSRHICPLHADESGELFHVISILLIAILPNLVHNFFTEKVNHKVRKLKVRQSVVEYYQTLVE